MNWLHLHLATEDHENQPSGGKSIQGGSYQMPTNKIIRPIIWPTLHSFPLRQSYTEI